MYKKTIITILLALVAIAGQGQEIKKVAATPEDFMEHMALCGYEVYTYDISSLRDSVSGFTIVIREYNQQGMIDEKKARHLSPGQDPRRRVLSRSVGLYRDHHPAIFSQ